MYLSSLSSPAWRDLCRMLERSAGEVGCRGQPDCDLEAGEHLGEAGERTPRLERSLRGWRDPPASLVHSQCRSSARSPVRAIGTPLLRSEPAARRVESTTHPPLAPAPATRPHACSGDWKPRGARALGAHVDGAIRRSQMIAISSQPADRARSAPFELILQCCHLVDRHQSLHWRRGGTRAARGRGDRRWTDTVRIGTQNHILGALGRTCDSRREPGEREPSFGHTVGCAAAVAAAVGARRTARGVPRRGWARTRVRHLQRIGGWELTRRLDLSSLGATSPASE